MPDSVQGSWPTGPPRGRPRRAAERAKPRRADGPARRARDKAALPDSAVSPSSPRWWTARREMPDNWIYEIKFDGYRMLTRAERRPTSGSSPATATTGRPSCRTWPEALQVHGAARRLVRRRDHHAGRPRAGRLPGPAGRLRQRAHREHRLLPVRHSLLRGLRPARRAAAGAPRRAAAGGRAQAAREGALQRRVRRAARGSDGIGLPPRPGRRHRQAQGLGLRAAALVGLGQAQVRPAPGVRHRRLHRPARLAHRHRLAAAGRARARRNTAVCGQRGHRFQREDAARAARRLDALAADTSPFAADAAIPRGAHWVKPELVCEVAFGEWTRDGRIRHSVFHGLRADKPARGHHARGAAPSAPRWTGRPSGAKPAAPARNGSRAPAVAPARLPARQQSRPRDRRRNPAPPRSSWCATTRWWRR